MLSQVTTLSAGSAVAELKLEPKERNLVLVKLPPTLTNPSRSRAILKGGKCIVPILYICGKIY